MANMSLDFSFLKRRQTPKKSLKVMISSRSPRLLRKFTRSPVVAYSSRGSSIPWSNPSSPMTSPDGSLSGYEVSVYNMHGSRLIALGMD